MDGLKQAWERGLALLTVQPIVISVATVVENPGLLFLRGGVGDYGMARGAVETRFALEGRTVLAEAAACGKDLLDERRQGGVLGAGAVQDGGDKENNECDGRHEKPCQAVRDTKAPPQ